MLGDNAFPLTWGVPHIQVVDYRDVQFTKMRPGSWEGWGLGRFREAAGGGVSCARRLSPTDVCDTPFSAKL